MTSRRKNKLTNYELDNRTSSSSRKKSISKRKAQQILREFFLRSGYLRLRNGDKLAKHGSQEYKKGFEIRFVARDEKELELIRASISALNFTLSESYISNRRFIQPLYGKTITLKFKKLRDTVRGPVN